MNHSLKRILSFAFALILIASLAAPAFAAGRIKSTDGNITVGMYYVNDDGSGLVILTLASGDRKFSIDPKKIKVTKGTSGASMGQTNRYFEIESLRNEFMYKGDWKRTDSSDGSYTYTIDLSVKKTGTAKIVYYVGNKPHTVNLTITSKYKNPVKSATLSGVNGGKNFALAKDRGDGKLKKLREDVKGARLKIEAANGWRLIQLGVADMDIGAERRMDFGGNGVTRSSLYYGTLVKGHSYFIHARFYNTRTNQRQSITYSMGPTG